MLKIPVSMKKHTSGEEDMWENQISKHQLRGRIEVCAAELQGEGSRKRIVSFSQTPVREKTYDLFRRRTHRCTVLDACDMIHIYIYIYIYIPLSLYIYIYRER